MYIVPAIAYSHSTSALKDGKNDGQWAIGFTSFAILIFAHHLQIAIMIRHWTRHQAVLQIISILMFVPIAILINDSAVKSNTYRTTFNDILKESTFWLSFTLTLGMVILPLYAYQCVQRLIIYPQFNK